jgi:Xaa-Pro aminopeptidase
MPASGKLQPSPEDLKGYHLAQRKAKQLADEIAAQIHPGMSERDAQKAARRVFAEHRVTHHWHAPIIALAEGTTRFTSASRLVRAQLTKGSTRAATGDLIYIDIAPIHAGYPSDYTLTRVLGTNATLEALAAYAAQLAQQIVRYLSPEKSAAEVWRWVNAEVQRSSPYVLAHSPVSPLGHRIGKLPSRWMGLPEAGLWDLLFSTPGPFMTSDNQAPMQGLWVVEPYLLHAGRAAKFELFICVTDAGVEVFGDPL